MPYAPTPRLDRRQLIAALGALGAAGSAHAAPRPVITLFGDSITAGFGLRAADALPAQLQLALQRRGVTALVRGAGVSGDTTQAGLARVDFSVQPDTRLAVVALGGNDLLRGVDPKRTEANLNQIIAKLKARRIKVLLVGLTAPRAAGASYARDFNALFSRVARRNGVRLHPDLLAGVAGLPALNQQDRIHPNAAGVKVIANRLAPSVAQAL